VNREAAKDAKSAKKMLLVLSFRSLRASRLGGFQADR